MLSKSLLLLLISLPLWVHHIPESIGAFADSQEAATDSEEKPFVLLATVHNYGYVEPCG